MEPTPGIRVDRWLWAVRLYRTRSLAAAACQGGHVQINDQPGKPARIVRPGDIIAAQTGQIRRLVRVRAVLTQRVAAKVAPQFVEDLTPPSEYEKLKQNQLAPVGIRPKGAGRPTKRERRKLGSFFGLAEPPE